MIDQIKTLRVKIDGLAQLTKELKPIPRYPEIHVVGEEPWYYIPSNEINKTYDSLILAKAWLGKVLGELGTESPYKSGYKTVSDIEPTADIAELIENDFIQYPTEQNKKGSVFIDKPRIDLEFTSEEWQTKSHIEKVDWLRTEIESIINEIKKLDKSCAPSREFAIARTNTFTHLSEARFWLGFELQRIKKQSDKQ